MRPNRKGKSFGRKGKSGAVPLTARRRKPVASNLHCTPTAVGHAHILALLDEIGRNWRIVYSSSDSAGIQLAVASGDLLTVLPESAVPANWRRPGEEEGLPLPLLRLAMILPQQPRLPVRQLPSFLFGRNFNRARSVSRPPPSAWGSEPYDSLKSVDATVSLRHESCATNNSGSFYLRRIRCHAIDRHGNTSLREQLTLGEFVAALINRCGVWAR